MAVQGIGQVVITVGIETVHKLLPLIAVVRSGPVGKQAIGVIFYLGEIIAVERAVRREGYGSCAGKAFLSARLREAFLGPGSSLPESLVCLERHPLGLVERCHIRSYPRSRSKKDCIADN